MRKHTFGEWMIAVRPWSLPASAMPIIVTLAFLFYKGSDINWLYGLWALVGMMLFHLTGNTWSDYFDYRKKVDAEDTFGAKTMTTGMFQPEEIKKLAIGLLIVSVICGLGLFAVTGLPLLYIGIAGAALTLLYPILKYNALGDLDILLTFAFLPTLGTSYAATGAVFRILKARFELGEMEPDENVSWHSIPSELLACDEHHALALKMARETMTLLQNRNNVLPLKKEARYAVVGPNAADSLVMWGNYNGIPRKTTTVLEGVIAKVGAENVVYAPGCDIAAKATDEGRYSETEGNYHDEALSRESGASETGAVDLSMFNDVDAIIFVGGLSPKLEGEEMRVNFKGFKGGDRTSIELPETQRAYIKELQKTGKPIIFVHLSGSAVALAPEAEICDAILQGWYAGQAGGEAVADVLFGDYNPAGRLPVTFYASDADLPDFGDYDMPGHTYRYFKGKPLFPFGHGLSFSKFKYRRARLSDGVLRIKVKNRGKMDGDEVVQVYVKKADDVDGPVMSLRGFKRVHVKAGKKAVVEIPLSAENIDLFNPETGKMEAASGKYIVYYGGTSDITKLRKLKMTI